MLERAQTAQAQKTAALTSLSHDESTPTPPDTFLGMTMGALFAGLVLSSIGMGFVIYAKSETQPLFALFGIALFVVPFFLTSTWPLSLVGAALVLTPILAKRYLHW